MTDPSDGAPSGGLASIEPGEPIEPIEPIEPSEPSEPSEALLTIRGLRVVIDGLHILHGVDLDVARTGVTALLGRNGAGKTTTVKAVMGLVPRSGSVRFEGRELATLPTHMVVRQGIGYAPEDRGIFGGLTTAENLRLAERGAEPRYSLVYELFPELRERAGQLAGSLSGGQQQMVAIARTLLNGNRLIIADEPTKGLAPKIVTEVADVLARVAEAVPVLLVEQNLALVRRVAGTCAVLADGRTAHQGDAAELLADEEAARHLLGVGSYRATSRASSGVAASAPVQGPAPVSAPVQDSAPAPAGASVTTVTGTAALALDDDPAAEVIP